MDDLHIFHNASGVEAKIRVLLIRNISSHSLLVVSGLEHPCNYDNCVYTRLGLPGLFTHA